MSEVSRSKLKNLPYHDRLTLSLKQKDFIHLICEIIIDYPGYDHSIIEDELIKKCNASELCTFLNKNEIPEKINLKKLTSAFAEKTINDYKEYIYHNKHSFNLSAFNLILSTISRYKLHVDYQESALILVEKITSGLSPEEDTCSIYIINKLYIYYSTIPNVAEVLCANLFPYINKPHIMEITKILIKEGIKDKDLDKRIREAIMIYDIIN